MAIYFLYSKELNRVKIGKADYPHRRHNEIKGMSPTSLECLVVEKYGGVNRERELHEQFNEYKHHGEWFNVEGKLADFIKTKINNNSIKQSKKKEEIPIEDKLFLSLTECAEVMQCSKSLIYSMCKSGEIPSMKRFHRILIPKQAFLDLIHTQIKEQLAGQSVFVNS